MSDRSVASAPREGDRARYFIGLAAGGIGPFDAERARPHLTARELAEAGRIAGAQRRAEWLATRLVAKQAVCRGLAACGIAIGLRASDVEVASDSTGQPAVVLPPGVADRVPIAISLSHAEELRGCAVQIGGRVRRIGFDVEAIDPTLVDLVDRICAERERRWVELGGRSPLLATLLWSLKEAAIKWTGGATARRKAYPVELGADGRSLWVTVPAQLGTVPTVLRGKAFVYRRHVVAWVRAARC